MSSDVRLANLINDWLRLENLSGSFSIVFPRDNDTIMAGLEGWIRYDHHSEGFATVVTIYDKNIYIDYDDALIEASDPEFFPKLKAVLQRHETVHKDCQHIRNIND